MKKNFFIAAGLSLALVAAGIGSLSIRNEAREAHALNTFEINNAATFKTCFNGSAEKSTFQIDVTADIDLSEEKPFSGRLMAGEFEGVFDGHGHTISGFTLNGDSSLFNLIKSTGIVKDTTFVWTAGGKQSSITYNNNGLFTDVTSVMTIDSDSTYGVWGPSCFSFAPGSGTFSNCISGLILNAENGSNDAGTYPAALVGNNGEGDTKEDCKYYVNGTATGSLTKVRSQGASLISAVTAISLNKASISNLNPDDTDTVTLSMTGTEYNSVTWTSLDTNVATVSGNPSGATITAVAGGTTTVKVEVESTNGNTYEASVSVSVNAAATDVTEISISNTSEIVYVGDNTNLSITLEEGTLYNSIVWSSSNTSVATVSGNNLTASVTAVAAGKATITVRVNTDSGYVEKQCLFRVFTNRFMPLDGYKEWGGAGLFLGVDVSKLPNDYNGAGNFTATITSSAQGAGSFVNFQSHGGHTCAYVTFNKAASEISTTFSINFSFVYKSTTTYTAELKFTGEEYVAPTVTVSFTNDIVIGDTFDISASSNYTVSDFDFTSSDEAKVSLDNATSTTVEGSAIVVGNSTIRATAIINGAEVYGEKVATVAAIAADVSEIELNETSGLLKVGEHANLTVEFVAGRNYESIQWTSDDTDVATVSANGVNCTVNALAAGSANITVKVITESTPLGITATYELSVTADLYKDIYFAVPKAFTGLSGTYAAWIYNGGAQGEATSFSDTGIDVIYKEAECNLYVASINLDHAYDTFATNTLYFQFCIAENTGARFGAGYLLGNEKANVTSVVLGFNDYTVGSTAINKIGNGDDMVPAIEFYNDNIKAVRDANSGSVCSANFTNVVAAYNALSANVKSLANIICDNTAKYDDVTVLDTINMMNESLSSGSSNFVISSTNNNDSTIIILIISLIGLVALTGAAIYLKKRKAE